MIARKVRILHIVGKMDRGGAETFLMNVMKKINKEKFVFLFLCYGNDTFDYEEEIISLGGIIVRTPDVKEVGILKHIENIVNIIKYEKIDIIHAHTYYNSIFSLIAAKKANLNIRITHSHTTRSEYKPSLQKKIYFIVSKFIINKYSTYYIACGKEAGKSLFYEKNSFTIVENGIILDNFYFNGLHRKQFRNSLKLHDDTVVIGHVGRIDIQKNHKFIVDVFAEYLKLNSNSRLVLLGEGVLRTEIETVVKNAGIQDKVIFLGKRSDVNKFYNIMDLFIFPSLREGLPLTLVEAQANGLTCLVSDTVDKAAQLTDRVHFTSLSQGAKRWAYKINTLSTARTDTKGDMKGGAYDMEESIHTIEDLYDGLVSGERLI